MLLPNRYVDAGHCRPTPNLSYKPRNHSIAVYLINARSLVNKMDLLRCYLCDFRPAIVCITESWAHSDPFSLSKVMSSTAVIVLKELVVASLFTCPIHCLLFFSATLMMEKLELLLVLFLLTVCW